MAGQSVPPAPGTIARPALSPMVQLGLIAGPMLSMIDTAVVNVAVPSIARQLQSPLSTVQWTVSSYLLALAAGQAGTAWVARRFGTLRAYTASIVLFTVASLICALAPNMGVLILGRIAQGLGGAPLVPLALGLLLGRDGEQQRIPVSAGLMLFAAPALGPALGGLLVSSFGWRSIFLINPIIGLVALVGVTAAGRRGMGTPDDAHAALDGVGVVILAAGLALATYGASQGAEQGWLTAASLPWWVLGTAAAPCLWPVGGATGRHARSTTGGEPGVAAEWKAHPGAWSGGDHQQRAVLGVVHRAHISAAGAAPLSRDRGPGTVATGGSHGSGQRTR